MPELFRLKVTVTAILCGAAVILGAAEKELFPQLPADSAAVFGAEISALGGHPQGALVLSLLQSVTDIPVEKVKKAVLGGDKKWRRWSLIARVDEYDLDKLCSRLYVLPEAGGRKRIYPAYHFAGTVGDKRASHLIRLGKCDAAIIYPVYRFNLPEAAEADLKMRKKVQPLLPHRATALIWGAVIAESDDFLLRGMSAVEFALENQLTDKLRLHGKIICRTSQDASSLLFFIQLSIPMVMAKRFNVPGAETAAALQALQLARIDNIIYFSTENFEAVFKVFLPIFNTKIPSYPTVQ